MEVGVQVVGYIAILLHDFKLFGTEGKLLAHSASLGCLGISVGEVADGNALASVFGTHPVAVGQIDADGG